MWREQDYLHPRARLGYFPANADGNELVVFDPEDPERELERLVFPRQPKHDRICLADFFRPLDSGNATSSPCRA
jgi:5-methyltetrahydrofolate--homocysteine methyltransferase